MTLAVYTAQFRAAVTAIGQLAPAPDNEMDDALDQVIHDTLDGRSLPGSPLVSVIVPAYNEADNIQACVTSILNSTKLSQHYLEVWVVDDQSSDETWEILNRLQQQLQDPRLHVLAGSPRPTGECWNGKNWACAQAATCARGEFLLFIDADVRLKPGAIAAAIQLTQTQNIDLLNCIPAVVCGSLVEWLVQPLICISLVISLNQPAIRDPNQEIAYAAGPFLLFRRRAYDQVGGHRAVAHEVAEDVALARAFKREGFTLQYRLGANLANLRMYNSWASLWEGWTKVLYVGAWRNVGLMLALAVVMLNLYIPPWIGLGYLLGRGMGFFPEPPPNGSGAWGIAGWNLIDWLSFGMILLCLGLQYFLRSQAHRALHCPPKYWWLQSLGGFLIAVMAIVSVIKGETGWGWTWRGRPLKRYDKDQEVPIK